MRSNSLLMSRKTVFALILILMLSLYLPCLGSAALAVDSGGTLLKATADKANPKVGETITVTVNLTGNTGFAALQFDVLYNTSVLSCTDCTRGKLLKDATLATANPDNDGAITVASATLDEIKEDGIAVIVKFKVIGKGDAGLGLSVTDLCDVDLKAVSCSVQSDKVTASESSSGTAPVDTPVGSAETGGQWSEDTGSSTGSGADNGSSSGTNSGSTGSSDNSGSQVSLFSDTTGHWAEKDIRKISSLGLITGFDDGSFKPNDDMTRAQFAVILWRMAGKPEPAGTSKFTDLKASWYEKAAAWASEKGYINGTGGTLFSPDSNVSRQELVTILFRYSGSASGMETMLTGTYDGIYSDSGDIAVWGRSPMYWAVYNSIITGITDKTLEPGGQATRAQVAAIIGRYLAKFK